MGRYRPQKMGGDWITYKNSFTYGMVIAWGVGWRDQKKILGMRNYLDIGIYLCYLKAMDRIKTNQSQGDKSRKPSFRSADLAAGVRKNIHLMNRSSMADVAR